MSLFICFSICETYCTLSYQWIYHPKIVSISIAILQFRCPRMMVKKTIIRGHSSFLPHAVGIPAALYAVRFFIFLVIQNLRLKKLAPSAGH